MDGRDEVGTYHVRTYVHVHTCMHILCTYVCVYDI